MEWTYKKTTITIRDWDGMFIFTIQGKKYVKPSLTEAKNTIDEITSEYYKFTKSDVKNMYRKLTDRERDFVDSLIEELSLHYDSAYCELSITNNFEFDLAIINDRCLKRQNNI